MNAPRNFASLDGLTQEQLVLKHLFRCGRASKPLYWYDVLKGVEAIRAQAALDERAAADCARLGMADVASDTRADAANLRAWANEVEAAVFYFHPHAQEAYRFHRANERAREAYDAAHGLRAA